jgi:uncharacterized RDD family membrane protein YckC
MADRIEFETPENVIVSYRPAGLGSRFIAWFADEILYLVCLLVIIIVLLLLGVGSELLLGAAVDDPANKTKPHYGAYFLALIVLIYGLGSFAYFGLSEYLMHGRTIGKRSVSLRVVKIDGFALDAGSILIRNIFRAIDHVPLLWVVPFVSEKSQRLGDLVAGTVVISDEPAQLSPLREQILNRPAEHVVFHFETPTLRRARPTDFESIERILERFPRMAPAQRERLLETVCEPLARRLNVEPPAPDLRPTFLIDLLYAEFRRQHREIG